MTLTGPLWTQNGSTSAATDRALLSAVLDEGVIDAGDLKVGQRAAGANMSVDVAPGTAAIQGDTVPGQGLYVVRSDAVANLPVNASPPVGTSRIDLVVAKVRDSQVDAGSHDDWLFQAVPGVPAASPLAPGTPPSALLLARVVVGGGVTVLTGFMIPDQRVLARPMAPVQVGIDLGDQYAAPSFTPWGPTPLDVAVPPFPVVVSAQLTGMVVPAGNGSVLVGWRVEVSFDGGATWQPGQELQGLTDSSFNPSPTPNQAFKGGNGAGLVKVRAQIKQYGGGTYAQFRGGSLQATVTSAP